MSKIIINKMYLWNGKTQKPELIKMDYIWEKSPTDPDDNDLFFKETTPLNMEIKMLKFGLTRSVRSEKEIKRIEKVLNKTTLTKV